MSLFSRTVTAASLWVHLLSINLYAARSAYLQGLQNCVPTRHTVLLSSLFAPLGLISAVITNCLCQDKDSRDLIAKVP
ncbi:hypothetical protein WJX75_001410 [Coccomyxa subellipsoidea]|uniref:Uncharacterized protein n=1 Tax=Coccomyxa subellipsoidea TaxID=248742 RepID=A0ABR2YJX3_9CHLO